MTRSSEARREYMRRWRSANHEHLKEVIRQWRERNRERVRESQRTWRERNPDWRLRYPYLADCWGQWRAANPDRAAIVREANKIVASALRSGRLARGAKCEDCGRSDRPLDAAHANYAEPLAVRWLCRPCHTSWDRLQPKTLTHRQ